MNQNKPTNGHDAMAPEARPVISRAAFHDVMQRAGDAAARNVAASLQAPSAPLVLVPGQPAPLAGTPDRVTRDELVKACGHTAAVMVGVVLDLLGVQVVDVQAPPVPAGEDKVPS